MEVNFVPFWAYYKAVSNITVEQDLTVNIKCSRKFQLFDMICCHCLEMILN